MRSICSRAAWFSIHAMTHLIRIASVRDASALAALARETFVDTYAAFNTVQDMNLHLGRSYSPDIQRRELGNVSMLTIVAENQGQLTGFAQGHFSEPTCHPAMALVAQHPWEILRFYLHRDWHGRGIAAQLMQRALVEATAAGADAVWLSVWSKNERAQAFYRKCGFATVGDTTFTLGSDVQHDFVMAYALRW